MRFRNLWSSRLHQRIQTPIYTSLEAVSEALRFIATKTAPTRIGAACARTVSDAGPGLYEEVALAHEFKTRSAFPPLVIDQSYGCLTKDAPFPIIYKCVLKDKKNADDNKDDLFLWHKETECPAGGSCAGTADGAECKNP